MILVYFLGLLLFLLPSYMLRLTLFGFPTTVLELLVAVFIFLIVVRFSAGGGSALGGKIAQENLRKIKNLGKINYAIALFVLAGIISTLISPDKRAALGQLKAFIIEPVLLFYASVLIIQTKEHINVILKFLFASAFLISLFGLLQYFTYIHLPLSFWGTGEEVQRITSIFDYPNALSLYLAPLIGFFFSLILSHYEIFKNKWVEWGGMGVMGIALLLTFSRGAWLAVGIAILILLIKQYGIKKVAPLVLAAGLFLFLIPSIQQRVKIGLSDPSSNAHFELIQTAWQKIYQNPLLGNGLAGFAQLNLGVNYPHNIFLNFWLEMGLLGLISFCWIITLAWEQTKKPGNILSFAAGVFLLILLIHGLVDAPYFKNDLSVLFWFMISICYIPQSLE